MYKKFKRNLFCAVITGCFAFVGCKEINKESNMAASDTTLKGAKADSSPNGMTDIKIIPITHATAVLQNKEVTIYVDPTGGAVAFEGQKTPTVVLITDIHSDHFDIKTLEALDLAKADLIVPQAVADEMPESLSGNLKILNNGEKLEAQGMTIEAIPMYNLREEAKQFHTKGRGNGYVLSLGDKRVYISGDTEDIPEMRSLKNIDIAFVCMNLPYTMTEESAAEAVLAFKPTQVYPYHYRGKPEVSDVAKFKELVNKGNSNIEVVQLDWYPEAAY